MGAPGCTKEQFIHLFRERGGTSTAKFLGVSERAVYARRARLERDLGIDITAPTKAPQAPPKILLLDIETAPHKVYTWGLWDQNVALNQIEEPGYTLCWAAKWYGEDEIMFASIRKDGREKMLRRIYRLMEAANIIIHYNGTKFDIPTLNQEFMAASTHPPTPSIQIDLLRTVRQRFRLPSNKLDYVARHLDIDGKHEHKGMELWRGCMDGDTESWKTMRAYNEQDVRLLEKVYQALLPWISNHPAHSLFNESLAKMCPNCGGTDIKKNGFYYTKTQRYQQYRCKQCGGHSRERMTNLDIDKRRAVLAAV